MGSRSPVGLIWIQQICFEKINNRLTCFVESKLYVMVTLTTTGLFPAVSHKNGIILTLKMSLSGQFFVYFFVQLTAEQVW